MTGTDERMLRIAACVARQSSEGKDLKLAVEDAARYFDVAPAAIWHCIHFAKDYAEDLSAIAAAA